MTKRQIIILILTLVVALGLRIYFIPAPGYERDIQLFKIWGQTAAEHGVHNVYNKTWCDYPPAYLYVLKVTGSIYRIFYPNFREHTYLFDFLIKFPAILADLLISLVIFLFLRKTFSYKISLLAMAAYAFNPAIIFNSAYWGQVDSVPILITLLAVLALIREKYYWAWGLITAAILIKTQMIVLLPIFILVTWKRSGFKMLGKGVMASWLTFLFVLLPFFYFHKIDQVIERVLGAVGEYPYLSMNAFNIWWLFSGGQGRWVSDTHVFLNLFSYRTLGAILLGAFFILLLKYLFAREKDESAIILGCALAFFAFFMLPTEMHERYVLPVFVFLLLSAIRVRSFKIIYGILSLTSFFSLLIVLFWAYPKNVPAQILSWPLISGSIVISIINVVILIYFLYVLLQGIKIKYLAYFSIVMLIFLSGLYLFNRSQPVYLSDLEPASVYQQWGKLKRDRSVDGNHLTVNGYKYAKGLGTHANSEIVYKLDGRFKFLEGSIGLDDEQRRSNKISFLIYADSRLIFESGIIGGWQNPRYFYLPVAEAAELKLVVNDGGDGINYDHADWLGVKLLP